MKQKTLSPKQERMLAFIRQFLGERGYPPTVRDIVRGCGLSSTSVVDYNLTLLERGGYLRRDREVSRGIELAGRKRLVGVPLLGYIAAGEPLELPGEEAWHGSPLEVLEMPQEVVKDWERVYALKVKGTSMIDALIADGDTLVMRPARQAENGEMVAVWLKDKGEVTFKRFYLEGDRVRLQPENSLMAPIYCHPSEVEVQGKVVAVLRTP